MKAYDDLLEENAALAAHVERFNALYRMATGEYSGGMTNSHVVKEYAAICRDTPETSLAKRDAEQQKIGAASFRHEVMESVKTPFRPHIQGVFEAWLRRQAGGDA